MPEAARENDSANVPACTHGNNCCPHNATGPITTGSPDVFINGLPAARKGDPGVHAPCCGGNNFTITGGSSTVFVNGKPLARKGDETTHCGGKGQITAGSSDVIAN